MPSKNRTYARRIADIAALIAVTSARLASAQPAEPAAESSVDGGVPAPPENVPEASPANTSTANGDGTPPSVPPTPSAPPVAPAPPSADTPPSPAEPITIEVTGHRLEETLPNELSRYGTRVYTIRSEEIRNEGEPDVAGTLEKLTPGLYLSPKNGPFDYFNVSLQGSRTQDLLFLLDGVRLNNRLYGGTTPLDTFPASIVDRLEIVEGPQALFYGTQSVAGAINIVTRPFSDSEQPDGAIAVGANTIGGRHVDGYVRSALGRQRFVVYGSADESTGFQPFRDRDYQPSATTRKRGYEVLTLGAKYAYDFRRDLRASVLYQHTDAKLDFAQPFLVAIASNERVEDIATAKVEYSPSDSAEFFAKGYYHRWKSFYTEFDNVAGSAGNLTAIDNHDAWGFTDFGANVVGKISPAHAFDAFVGYDVQSYQGSDAVLVIKKQSEVVNAVFAQIRTPDSLEKVRFATGIRYNVPSVGQSALVWNTTGQYTFGEALFIRGTTGTAFRLPTAEELFANDPEDERGNPDLKPERSINANLSVGGRLGFMKLPGVSWEAIGFYRNVTDLISASGFDAVTNQSLFENIAGTVHVRGGTFVVDARLSSGWSGTASYTFSSAEQAGDLQIDRVPRQQAKAWLDWHPSDLPIGGMIVANYVGDVYQSFGDSDREKIGRHVVLDVGARAFLGDERRHKISATLSNAIGTVYASSLGKGTADVAGTSYTYWNLGAPRALSLRYQYQF